MVDGEPDQAEEENEPEHVDGGPGSTMSTLRSSLGCARGRGWTC